MQYQRRNPAVVAACASKVTTVRTYAISEVARLLGVSTDSVRRWGGEGRFDLVEVDGRQVVSGPSLADYLKNADSAYDPDTGVAQSARNRLTGIVTKVDRDGVMAVVEIHAPPHRIVSIMTREAADDLELAPGELATAVIKSTNVIIERTDR